MNFRKISGILVGILLGLVPFIGPLACCIYAFKKKKFRAVLLLVVTLLSQMAVAYINSRDIDKRDMAVTLFSASVHQRILTIKIPADGTISIAQLEDSITQRMEMTAAEYSRKQDDVAKGFVPLARSVLSDEENQHFQYYLMRLHKLYVNDLDSLRKAGHPAMSLADLPGSSQRNTVSHTRAFVSFYLTKELTAGGGWIAMLLLASYTMSIALCIVFFKNAFTGNQDSHTNNNGYTPVSTAPANNRYPPATDQEIAAILATDIPATPAAADMPPPLPTVDAVKINMAREEEIAPLPGIGTVQAMRIIQERQQHGFFISMDDFKNRMSLAERVYRNLADKIDFTVPQNGSNGPKGRVIEF
ncbi:ComEA family DNA-binding protein [Chitinophaga nivalis]|uniref:Helix-hairpin-helix domain-containing protein n=1 Tax=Chitinophaga nivalis TaxID=2991709 RepID=A0ABT3IQT7_9BACT|nr:helix-hairpin-helix domain-containing protein [Chitinophaga nivalis]MCW3463997.1 helix-hairpin-helix domain-containing protein [Chitinophaga nivalis]MCW3486313.1 helix-hairpin-helix domain-containing protein [Chitinophaga nivalis]